MSIIWIDQDNTPVFAGKYWSDNRLWIGVYIIIVLSIIISFFILHYFRIYDKKQKTIKLYVEFGEHVTIQKEITPHLSKHVEHIHDVINIIYQFAAIPDTIIISNMYGMARIIIYSLLYILLLTIPYTIICHLSLHIEDSYRSFVDVPCVFVSYSYIQFDLKPICNATSFSLDDFIIYGEHQTDTMRAIESCYVDQKLKFRTDYDTNCICSCCRCCGSITCDCGEGHCLNCCGYLWCSLAATAFCVLWV